MLRCFGKAKEVVSRGWCQEENGTVNTTGSTTAVVVAVGAANCSDSSRAVICRDDVALFTVWTFGNKSVRKYIFMFGYMISKI